MSYAELIRTAVSGAMAAVGDLAEEVQYHSISGDGVYNVSTDTVTVASTVISVRAVLARFSKWEIQNQVADIQDQKAIIAASDLGVTPSLRDFILISGDRWVVQRIQTVPGQGVYIFQISPSG